MVLTFIKSERMKPSPLSKHPHDDSTQEKYLIFSSYKLSRFPKTWSATQNPYNPQKYTIFPVAWVFQKYLCVVKGQMSLMSSPDGLSLSEQPYCLVGGNLVQLNSVHTLTLIVSFLFNTSSQFTVTTTIQSKKPKPKQKGNKPITWNAQQSFMAGVTEAQEIVASIMDASLVRQATG